MTNIIKFDDATKLPAHLRALQPQGADEWGSGQVSGFPVLSIKGKVFHIVRGDEKELVTRPDDPDEAATSIHLVVLKTHKGVARTYYADAYVEGAADAPDCYSNDGIAPAADAPDPQAKKCKLCPHSQWGSRVTEDGKKAKACSEMKRLAVAEPGAEDEPMLLRVPPTSLRNWDSYLRILGKKGVTPPMVVTKIGFDSSVAHQLLTFKPVGFVDEESAQRIAAAQNDEVVESIIGGATVAVPVQEPEQDDEDEEEAPAPRRASRRKKPEPEPEQDDEDDEDEEEAPAPRRRRKPEPKPEPEPEEDEEDEEDEEPAPRRRKKPEEKQAAKSEPKPVKVVEASGDLEDELDDLLGDLEFDD